MKKIIIALHGLGNKPSKDTLSLWWKEAIKEGLKKNKNISGKSQYTPKIYEPSSKIYNSRGRNFIGRLCISARVRCIYRKGVCAFTRRGFSLPRASFTWRVVFALTRRERIDMMSSICMFAHLAGSSRSRTSSSCAEGGIRGPADTRG